MIPPARPTDVVLRVERNHHYKTISTLAVEDERLSWKAKGLHTYLITRPDSWSFNCNDLLNRGPDGKDAVRTGLKELKDLGYLIIAPQQGAGGKIVGWAWTVFECAPDPSESTDPTEVRKNRITDNPKDGKPGYITSNRITNNNTQSWATSGPMENEGQEALPKEQDREAYPPEFEETWRVTPYRSGNNPKRAAYRAWTARRREGVKAATMREAAERYADYCDATGKTGTDHVMRGSTLFGPDRPYEQEWEIPSESPR
jgi:hypothetical protein